MTGQFSHEWSSPEVVLGSPSVIAPGTLDALSELQQAGHLSAEDAEYLTRSYRFLRSTESGLRLMNTTARHDLPDDQRELAKLAYLLGYDSGRALQAECLEFTRRNRELFNRYFA